MNGQREGHKDLSRGLAVKMTDPIPEAIEATGCRYLGYQEGLYCFRDPETDESLYMARQDFPKTGWLEGAVWQKIQESRARFKGLK